MTASSPTQSYQLSRIDRATVRDLALDQLKRYIASGAVAPGQRLPSERDLALQLGVGRNSVREALKVLGAVGIVESRIGEGTFISKPTGASIGRTIGLSLAVWGGALSEILHARQIFEIEAAGVAALMATAEDVESLSGCLSLMERSASNGEVHEYVAADMAFHRVIAQATHNAIVTGVVTNLIDLLEEVLGDAQVEQLEPMIESGATHRDIFRAVTHRDVQGAVTAMRTHLTFSTGLWDTFTTLVCDLDVNERHGVEDERKSELPDPRVG